MKLQNAASFLLPFVSLTTSLLLYCHSPTAVTEGLSHAVTVGFSGCSNRATRPRAFPGTTYQEPSGSSKRPSQVPNFPGRETSFRLTNSAPKHSEQSFSTLCPHCTDEVEQRHGGGMECSVALFKPRIHLFACTLPSVSNSCDCGPLFVCKHQSIVLGFKHV